MFEDTIKNIDQLLNEGEENLNEETFRTDELSLKPKDTDNIKPFTSKREAVKMAASNAGVNRNKAKKYLRLRKRGRSISEAGNEIDLEMMSAMDLDKSLRDKELLDNERVTESNITENESFFDMEVEDSTPKSERVDELFDEIVDLELSNEKQFQQFAFYVRELAAIAQMSDSAKDVLLTMQRAVKDEVTQMEDIESSIDNLLNENDQEVHQNDPDDPAKGVEDELATADPESMQFWLESEPEPGNAVEVGEALAGALEDLLDDMTPEKIGVEFEEGEGDENLMMFEGVDDEGRDVSLTVDMEENPSHFVFEVPEIGSKVKMRIIPHEPMSNLSLYLQRTRDAVAQSYRYSEIDQIDTDKNFQGDE